MTEATTAPVPTPTQIAVASLIQALDNSPRAHWGKVIEMALNAVLQKGYGEGYKVGAASLETVQEKLEIVTERLAQAEAMIPPGTPTPAPSPIVTEPAAVSIPTVSQDAGEDKSLANDTPDPDEELIDVGYQFLREIAKQLGRIAKELDVTPGAVLVQPYKANEGLEVVARLTFNLKNPSNI